MIKIDDKLKEEIKQYCALNKLKMGEFVNKLLKESFIREKYGEKPPMFRKEAATTSISVRKVVSPTREEPTPEIHNEKKEEVVSAIETMTTTLSKIKRRIIKTT